MDQTVIDFSTFHSRMRIPGRLYLDTPLRIGSGGTPSATDVELPVVKDLSHRPYIPGSSFKGAFRSHVEAILRALDFTLACDSIAKPATGQVPGCLSMGEVGKLKKEIEDPAELSRRLIASSCWTCRVFGAQWLASKVSFKDMPVAGETWFGRYQERSGVAIDRDTETAGEGLLYAAEAVPTGVEFNFEMVVDNPTDLEQGLVLLGLNEVERGQMGLGGARSRGLGWVTLRVDWEHAYRVDAKSLLKYLKTGQGELLVDRAMRAKLVDNFLAEAGAMHKQLVNELRLWYSISPVGPLLIKSGQGTGADPTLLDLNFVRVNHTELGETVYLPGSSLKGVIRSYSEKVARTVGVRCCDPLSKESCGALVERKRGRSSAEVYKALCTACRIFGHMPMASHVRLSDAYPRDPLKDIDKKLLQDTNRTEERDGVAIDRVSGAVAVGPFQLEVVTRGAFFGQLYLKNFQLWQVGLLAIALRDINTGLVPIGFAKSRGLGEVRLGYQRLEISYPGQMGQDAAARLGSRLAGVTAFRVEGAKDYDFEPEEPLALPVPGAVEAGWGRVTTRLDTPQDISTVLGATVEAWAAFVNHRKENPA